MIWAPRKMGFYAPLGTANPPDQTLRIENRGTGSLGLQLNVSTQTGGNWLSTGLRFGVAPLETLVRINAPNLPQGNYLGQIDAIGLPTGVPNSPRAIRIEFAKGTPYPLPRGFVDGAAFAEDRPVAAGGISSSFGWNLGIGMNSAAALPLPTDLGSVRYNFEIASQEQVSDGRMTTQASPNTEAVTVSAPLFFSSPGQVNLQVPWELAGQSEATYTVVQNGVASFTRTVELATFVPGIFIIGQSQGAVLLANTDILVAPAGSIQGRESGPAHVGEFITIFCSGLGPVTNTPASGQPAGGNPLSQTTTPPTVTIGGVNAPVSFAGLAPDFVGLYQVNVPIPAGVTPGNAVPVIISIGGETSNTATIAVQ
jgi:uncharacterized protein (TIGR03437 family)